MEKYYIEYFVDVSVDNYEDGIIEDNINYYNGDYSTEAVTVKDAIIEFFNDKLCFNINIDNLEFDDNLERFIYSVLCDNDNYEVNDKDSEFEDWKKGNINLYTNDVSFNIYKLENITKLN